MENIYVKNITKSFNTRLVLNKLNMEFKGGKINCIMAKSGAGKTTLLRIMMGLEQADSGTIEGLDNRRISAVFQEECLCENMTGVDNVRFVNPVLSVSYVRKELCKLGLADCVNQPVFELSGGMRRRVSIARALMAVYDILFLDEPFRGLDNECKEQVMQYVKEKTDKKTVIFVTHDINEAKKLDALINVWQ